MPELPEVEVLVRHLRAGLVGSTVRDVRVHRARVTRPTPPARLRSKLVGCRVVAIRRRAKYLLFTLQPGDLASPPFEVLAHLGMTGRLFVQANRAPRPRHTAIDLLLDTGRLVFEDTRYFGTFTLQTRVLERLGPEPLEDAFTPAALGNALHRSRQPVKVRLLDQSVAAGVGNIYASEALFRARVSPRTPAHRLTSRQVARLHRAIRQVLAEAIDWGSTVPLDWAGAGGGDGVFYYGTAPDSDEAYQERLQVYDRQGQPCPRCRCRIRRLRQAGRSTYFCPRCQRH